jgi:hypothetical protein
MHGSAFLRQLVVYASLDNYYEEKRFDAQTARNREGKPTRFL